ncbi:hypothetical protein PF005_g27620 [Phytophthora fragariae]|uniref:Uncharacterized protein n=2 Tax=Phytophthora fragariae TaxID=53985 RepID=A0A6A3VR05_9STRA|nr:hypothetical protein PF005_g27620 [Phytophthora fragariae]
MGAGITPREHLDEVAESLVPAKGLVKAPPVISVEMLEDDFEGVVLSFDGAAKTSTRKGSCGCVLWKLPGWSVMEAQGFILEDVTVNDAEYNGLLKGLQMVRGRNITELVVVGDSRIVIQQVQGLINCHQPNLQRKLAECEAMKEHFTSLRLVYVKRDFNQAADYITSKTLVLDDSWTVQEEDERRHLEQVSKIPEQLMKSQASPGVDIRVPESLADVSFQKENVDVGSKSAPLPNVVRVMAAVTRSGAQREAEDSSRPPLGPLEYQAERWRRIKVHQRSEEYLAELVRFLKGDFESFSPRRLRKIGKVADLFALDSRGILYRLARSTRDRPRDFADEPRLVVPKALQADTLHYAHEDYQGGHQGKTRTHERLRSEFYWPGMYADVDRFVEECVDCASGKGRPPNPGPSPGNITPRRPFEAVSMDFVTHMPKSARGNTFLLLFQDIFSGYVMCKPMSSTTAQNVAEAYEERVFRSFGVSCLIRHDQDPRFMSDVFTRFREFLGSRQRATLAYRPPANGQQERSVQTVIRSVRAYIAEADQSDWDDHAERLMFALNTSFDATRLETPFYLVHGWDAQGTVSAMLGPRPSSVQEKTAYEWRRKFQRDYSYALACAEDLQVQAKKMRSDVQTQKWKELTEMLKTGFEKGDAVWLYIPKVQTGLSRKLAHMWHGPFRIDEVHDDFRVRLKVEGTGYRVNPWVHISRLKPRALHPKRPVEEVEVGEDDDFDTALLPEDSWEPDSGRDEYEVEKILDLGWSKRTRTSKRSKEYLIKWKNYDDPEWLPVSQLSCGALLYEFNQSAKATARFQSMQAGDDHPRV